jgi:S-adenosylmethionine:diacylglycerol 3-amino-3-carboxypropyl transferase
MTFPFYNKKKTFVRTVDLCLFCYFSLHDSSFLWIIFLKKYVTYPKQGITPIRN